MLAQTDFEYKNAGTIWLNHCGVSPLTRTGFNAMQEVENQQLLGDFSGFARAYAALTHAAGVLLKTQPENITPIPNCTTALNNLALSLNLTSGDEVIVYQYDYPSPVQCWQKAVEQGVTIKKIQGQLWQGLPWKWELEELRSLITEKTKVVCLSHVVFTSGFAADLKEISKICQEKNILFICDAAQSVGCMPVFPEELAIDALVSSGWKWLMGPPGTGLMYTSAKFRNYLESTQGIGLVGPDMMTHGTNYLNHSISVQHTGRRFVPSTLPYAQLAGLAATIEALGNWGGIENIWKETQRVQHLIIKGLQSTNLELVPLESAERSGILAYRSTEDASQVVRKLKEKGIVVSARGFEDGSGLVYIRVAPSFHTTNQEIQSVVSGFNTLCS